MQGLPTFSSQTSGALFSGGMWMSDACPNPHFIRSSSSLPTYFHSQHAVQKPHQTLSLDRQRFSSLDHLQYDVMILSWTYDAKIIKALMFMWRECFTTYQPLCEVLCPMNTETKLSKQTPSKRSSRRSYSFSLELATVMKFPNFTL